MTEITWFPLSQLTSTDSPTHVEIDVKKYHDGPLPDSVQYIKHGKFVIPVSHGVSTLYYAGGKEIDDILTNPSVRVLGKDKLEGEFDKLLAMGDLSESPIGWISITEENVKNLDLATLPSNMTEIILPLSEERVEEYLTNLPELRVMGVIGKAEELVEKYPSLKFVHFRKSSLPGAYGTIG